MSHPDDEPDLTRYFQEQLAHSGDGVVVVDGEQRILFWNQAAALLLGYRSEEVLGKHCYDVMKTRECNEAMVCCQNCSSIRAAREHHWAAHHQLLAETRTGRPICLSVATFSVLSPDQSLFSLVHVFWEAENPADTATESVDTSRPPPVHSMEASPLLFLSRQERNVLRCLAAGMDTQAIAGLLFISPITVRNHIQNILRKLGVHSRLEAVALAHQHHWA